MASFIIQTQLVPTAMTSSGPKVTRRKACRLCGSKDVERVVSLPASPIAGAFSRQSGQGDRYPIDLYMCVSCGHVQLLDVVDPRLLFPADYNYLSGSTAGIVRHFEDCTSRILTSYSPPREALVVDVGSNDGTLLRCFQRHGYNTLGIDPAAELARVASEAGIETIPEFLNLDVAKRIRASRGPASVVTAFNVFAHADDLGLMLDCVREMLAPDGVFVFEVSYLLDIVEQMLLGTIFHEHLSYHSIRPLEAFLRSRGLKLIDVHRVGIQGGSIVGTVQLVEGIWATTPAVVELMQLELDKNLHRPETLQAFSTRVQRWKKDTLSLLEAIIRSGKTIAGFGAARAGTIVIYLCELWKSLSYIVDDSPQRQGTYAPGTPLPILPTSALYERGSDYAFILAWVHANKIMETHHSFAVRGGHFILPFPDCRVL